MPFPVATPRSRLRRYSYRLLFLGALALLLEAGARWALSSDALFQRIATPYDEPSWRLSWLRRHEQDEAPYRFSFDRYHPVRGWTLVPNLRRTPVFDGKSLSSNSRGLRGEREYAPTKPAGVTRIALFGDSFTFGEEVSDEETYARRIEDGHPEFEVLNFGVHGYGHDQMLLYLREVLPIYRPDVVLIGHVTDDSLRNVLTFRDFAKPRFRLRHGRLELEGTPVPTPEQVLARAPWRPRLLDLLSMGLARVAWRWGDRIAEVDRLTDAILTEIFQEALAAGARPAIALLPVWGELSVADPAPMAGEAFVLGVAGRAGVPCLRLRPLFLERARLGAEYEKVGHWGAAEHRVAAGGIVDFLRRERLVP